MATLSVAQVKARERRDRVIIALRASPDSTSKELGEDTGYMWDLTKDGYVKVSGRRSNGRGRPANLYRLVGKGSKRGSALAKRP